MNLTVVGSGLAQRLRDGTATRHRLAERSAFMTALLGGRTQRPMQHRMYLQLLHNLQPIYTALEPMLQAHSSHAWLAPLWTPAMARLPALVADMAELQRLSPCDLGPPQAASLDYARRLQALLPRAHGTAQDAQVARLLAHAYVRYLGDLSGGQVLKRALTKSLGLQGALGSTFFDFGSAEQASALQQRWRQGLAALPAHGAMADAAVDEACWSFDQHLRLFEALERLSPQR